MRLYFGSILRRARYSAAYAGHAAEFRYQLVDGEMRLHIYIAPTIKTLIASIKADGHQVWGHDWLDYSMPPQNAMEYVLMEQCLRATGLDTDDISQLFSLDTGTTVRKDAAGGDADPAD